MNTLIQYQGFIINGLKKGNKMKEMLPLLSKQVDNGWFLQFLKLMFLQESFTNEHKDIETLINDLQRIDSILTSRRLIN